MAVEVYGDARGELALWSLDTVSGAVGKQLDGLAVLNLCPCSLERFVLLRANLCDIWANLYWVLSIAEVGGNHAFCTVLLWHRLVEDTARDDELRCCIIIVSEVGSSCKDYVVSFSKIHDATVSVSGLESYDCLSVACTVYIDGSICYVNSYINIFYLKHAISIRWSWIDVFGCQLAVCNVKYGAIWTRRTAGSLDVEACPTLERTTIDSHVDRVEGGDGIAILSVLACCHSTSIQNLHGCSICLIATNGQRLWGFFSFSTEHGIVKRQRTDFTSGVNATTTCRAVLYGDVLENNIYIITCSLHTNTTIGYSKCVVFAIYGNTLGQPKVSVRTTWIIAVVFSRSIIVFQQFDDIPIICCIEGTL